MNKKERGYIEKLFDEMKGLCLLYENNLVESLFIIQHPDFGFRLGLPSWKYDEEGLSEIIREKLQNKEWHFPDTVEEETKNVYFTKGINHKLECKILYPDLDLENQYSFRLLFNSCRYLRSMYIYYLSNPSEIDIGILMDTEYNQIILRGHIYSLNTHWATVMDFKKELSNRARPGADEMKRKKLDRVMKVKDILPKYPSYKTDKKQRVALLSEAMKETDCLSPKSIENYLKELEIDK